MRKMTCSINNFLKIKARQDPPVSKKIFLRRKLVAKRKNCIKPRFGKNVDIIKDVFTIS